MIFLCTLRMFSVFLIHLFQLPGTDEIVVGQVFRPLQPLAPYPFTPLPNEELSDFVSAFVSTATQELKDSGLILPLFKLQRNPEEVQHGYFNRAYKNALLSGYSDPAAYATDVLKLTKNFQPSTNYELELTAGLYAIGQFLEDKGLLSDVNTAVEKAHELVKTFESYVNELPLDHVWVDYYAAISGASVSFLRSHGLSTPEEFILIRKRFFGHLPATMPL